MFYSDYVNETYKAGSTSYVLVGSENLLADQPESLRIDETSLPYTPHNSDPSIVLLAREKDVGISCDNFSVIKEEKAQDYDIEDEEERVLSPANPFAQLQIEGKLYERNPKSRLTLRKDNHTGRQLEYKTIRNIH